MHNDVNLKVDDSFEYDTVFYTDQTHSRVEDGKKIIENIVADEDARDCYAKEIINRTNNTSRYYVKFGDGRPINPFDGMIYRRIMERKAVEWRKVSKETFDHYIAFLRTRHARHLHYAERNI